MRVGNSREPRLGRPYPTTGRSALRRRYRTLGLNVLAQSRTCTIGQPTLPQWPSRRDRAAPARTESWTSPRPLSQLGGSMPTYLSPGVYVEEVPAGSPDRGRRHRGRRVRRPGREGPDQRADAGLQLDPVHRDVRRLRRELLPRPRRLRLLPQRRRQLLRRPDRRRQRNGQPAEGKHAPKKQAASAPTPPHVDREGRRHATPRPPSLSRRVRPEPRGPTTSSSWSSSSTASTETYDNVTTKRGQQRRHQGQRRIEADQPRGDHHRRALLSRAKGTVDLVALSRRPSRRRPTTSAPTTTSATPPTAPASAGSRRSTRSPWSPCRTSRPPTSRAPSTSRRSRPCSWR